MTPTAPDGGDEGLSGVLASASEIDAAAGRLGMVHRYHAAKTWDLDRAVRWVEANVEPGADVLDVGCSCSPVLEVLAAHGYGRLAGIDLTAEHLPNVPDLEFHRGDGTATPFTDGRFAGITCLSVIEHGVALEPFFGEMARIVAPGGVVALSMDYREDGLDTTDVDPAHTFGLPWEIFSRAAAESIVATAECHGLVPDVPVRWQRSEDPVEWLGKRYTFLFLALRRPARRGRSPRAWLRDQLRARSTRPRRPRVALVGVFPPTYAGIATYTGHVADALARRCDLDCFDETHESLVPGARPAVLDGARLFPVEDFGRVLDPGRYERVFYVLGSNPMHRKTLALSMAHPDISWLHDVNLVWAYLGDEWEHGVTRESRADLLDRIRAMYRTRLPAGADLPAASTLEVRALYEHLATNQVWMTGEAVRAARTVLVHSHLARRLVLDDAGVEPDEVDVRVVPMASPALTPTGPRAEAPVITTFGALDPVKRIDLAVRALARLPAELDATLELVGYVDAAYREEMEELARTVGVGDSVVFTGRVDEADYRRHLGRAWVAVQLRRRSHGESSAAVHDVLAAGLPVVTSIESCSELPSGTVRMVAPDVSPDALAAELLGLLRDPSAREALGTRARAYAAASSFDLLATRLLATPRSTSPRGGGR